MSASFPNKAYKRMPTSTDRPKGTWLDLSALVPMAGSPYRLIGTLDALLTHGAMSPDLRATLNNAIASMGSATPLAKAQRSVYLICSSPEYLVER